LLPIRQLQLKDALSVIGVRVPDHLIIAGTQHYSFAESGRL
jgi:DNA repair protein RadC